jgi:hypothetical protein
MRVIHFGGTLDDRLIGPEQVALEPVRQMTTVLDSPTIGLSRGRICFGLFDGGALRFNEPSATVVIALIQQFSGPVCTRPPRCDSTEPLPGQLI